MDATRRTRWTLLSLIAVGVVSAEPWHRLWDTQNHDLRIWLGVYCFAMAGALTTAFDVFVRTRESGPSYEPLWLTAWPLWSAAWFAFVAFLIAVYFAFIVLCIALPVLALLYVPYHFQARGIRDAGEGADADDLRHFDAWARSAR